MSAGLDCDILSAALEEGQLCITYIQEFKKV